MKVRMEKRTRREGVGTMPYVLQELSENGETTILEEPVHDIIVAKVIASRRAVRTQRLTRVTDVDTGKEVARFDPKVPASAKESVPAPKESVTRMRADAPPAKTESDSGISIKKSG
jgi:hypothetical protein